MSKNHLDQKSMLFGDTPMEKEEVNASKSSSASKAKPTTTTAPKKPHTHLSPSMCAKKIAEGQELHDKALKYLKTSLFQWSPDHVAAASTFESAANCYNAAGELEKAQELYLQSADSHDKAGSAAASAQTLLKASKVAKLRGDSQATADIHQRSSVMWGVHGDPNKAGEFLLKAAKELESLDPKRARVLYLQGLDHLCPEETPVDQMASCPAVVPEAFRQCFDFYMSVRSSSPTAAPGSYTIPTLEIVEFCNRMIRIFTGLEAEASKCRMMLTITLLQLELGDVVGADRGFMDNLSDSDYLKSNESALAEDFLSAYKELDCDKLEASQRSHNLMHLDRSVQTMARGLSLLRGHSGVVNEGTSSSTSKPSKTAADVSSNRGHGRFMTAEEKKKISTETSPMMKEAFTAVTEKDKEVNDKEEDVKETEEVAEEEVDNNDDNDNDDDDDFDLT